MQYPDMVVRIDRRARDLSQHPVVGKRLRPRGIRLELGYLRSRDGNTQRERNAGQFAAHVASGYFSGASPGAPVPVLPRNTFLPSAKVTSRPLALFEPSLA